VTGFQSPEEAALATWASSPSANAQVVSADIRADRAEVVLKVGPGYTDYVYCQRGDDGWQETVSGNGPTHRWDDPTYILWDENILESDRDADTPPRRSRLVEYVALVVAISVTDIAAISIASALDATWLWFPLQLVFLLGGLHLYKRIARRVRAR
jgi:hypothetical protein